MNINQSVVATTVRHLYPGDVFSVTGLKVVNRPVRLSRTPAGKLSVVVEHPDGRRVEKTMNANTRITVVREN